MNLIQHEFKKILTAPIIWALFLGTFLMSLWMIQLNTHQIPQLQILTEMVAEHGAEIHEESLEAWEALHREKIQQMNQTIGADFQTWAEMDDYFFQRGISTWNLFEDMSISRNAQLVENYFQRAQGADAYYQAMDLRTFGENLIEGNHFSESLNQIIRQNFAHAQEKFEAFVEQGEHRYFFFNNDFHAMHDHLFSRVLGTVAWGLTILVILSTGYLMNYEFDYGTHGLVYSTKKGRKLQWAKLKASLLATTLFSVLLLSLVLAVYFTVYDYSGLWDVPVRSLFLSGEGMAFLVSRYSLTFGQFVIGVALVIFGAQMLLVLMTTTLSLILKNGYLVPVLMSLIALVSLFYHHFIPHNSLLYYLGFTPFRMLADLYSTFMVWGVSQTHPHYELVTLGGGLVSLSILCLMCYKQFSHADLKK